MNFPRPETWTLGPDEPNVKPGRVRETLERIDATIAATSTELRAYIKEYAEFADIGDRMIHRRECSRV